jgi:hypothetical protein
LPFQIHKHVDYIEVRLEGVLDVAPGLEDVQAAAGGPFSRLLVDFTGVTEVRADPYSLADRARNNEDAGIKIAFYAPRPALFGVVRQVLQLGSVHEGVTASAFKDVEAAREWLRSG